MKIVHEWNGHLEIVSCPQAIEFQEIFLLLRTLRYFTENSRRVLLFTGLYHLKQGYGLILPAGLLNFIKISLFETLLSFACILDGLVFEHVRTAPGLSKCKLIHFTE